MNTSEKIYCIVVTFNAEHWIEKCLNSVINSSIFCTIIIVDNHSTDRTAELIKDHYPMVKFIQNNVNFGFGKANNIAIKLAYEDGADYFFLLNQDAWVEVETIQLLINKHKQNTDYGILSPLHYYNSKKLDRKFQMYLYRNGNVNIHNISEDERNSIISVRFVNAAMWLISRKCIETVGLFAPIFDHYGEDQNYAHRCKFHHFKIGVYPKAIGYHERNQFSTKEKNITLKKLLIGDRHFCLSILLNLKHTYLRQWMFILFKLIKDLFKNLFLFRFKTLIVVLYRLRFIFRILELNKLRLDMKKKGAYLLQ